MLTIAGGILMAVAVLAVLRYAIEAIRMRRDY